MTEMLSVRLRKIIDCIPHADILADVGCDHGYIGTFALLENRVKETVFIDISRPSLDKAIQFATSMGVGERCRFLHRDGLGNCRADVAVIAGMGGMEIISVLKETEKLPDTLVLQPMKNVCDLRIHLQENYRLQYDKLFKDGKYYNLIVAAKGSDSLSADEIAFGRTNLDCPDESFVQFISEQLEKYRQIALDTDNQQVHDKVQQLRETLKTVKEKTQCYNQKC